mgnify:CR=1 FL=1
MKKIEAIIRPQRIEDVKEALRKLDIKGLTVLDAQGYGKQLGHKEIYRGQEYTVDLVRKAKLEIIVEDNLVESAIKAIIESARSDKGGAIGDGKIFIYPVEDVVRIRTGERGSAAV